MNDIALLSPKQRQELFSETANSMNTTNAIIEKDFWVVWVLDKIFSDSRLNKKLMFKGGTSLSKVFNLIGRFSEDIDLVLDWREVTSENPEDKRASKNKQIQFNKKVNKDGVVYIKEQLLPIMTEIISPLCSCKIDEKDMFNINITYPVSFKDSYLRPEILLEIGPLASWSPSDIFEISSYASQKFPDVFTKPLTTVNAIVAKRTFWEKATILHQEAHRVKEKAFLPRYSRHYYDMAMMAKSDIKDKALSDLELLQQVIDFKNKFYPATWAKFDTAKPDTLKLVPSDFRIDELKKDYKAMENMIFDKQLSFEKILHTLKVLEDEINALGANDD